jgi:hypothetical protein
MLSIDHRIAGVIDSGFTSLPFDAPPLQPRAPNAAALAAAAAAAGSMMRRPHR